MTGGGGGGGGRSRRPLLSDDDQRLWEHVARSVATRVRGKARVLDAAALQPPGPSAGERPETASELHARLESGASGLARDGAPSPVRPSGPVKVPRPHTPPPIADFDRKAARRIRSGRTEIEARIDLHGMRQDEAHTTLRSFLYACHARRLRWVLVITGKGRPARLDGGDDGALPARQRRDDLPSWHDDGRGVLKRVVPRWLGEPELRAIVVSYQSASVAHGGEGALYVQLRAKR